MIAAAFISAASLVLVAVIGLIGRVKLQEIHVLVNNRLSEALSEIAELKEKLTVASDNDPPE